jgi:hypothetical protein
MEQLLLRCVEKDPALRPQSAVELKACLLAVPTAADWTTEARVAWWQAYEHRPAAEIAATDARPSTSINTVRIKLGSRVK